MATHRLQGVEPRAGARKLPRAPRTVVDPTPVLREAVLLDDRRRPIPRKRPKGIGDEPRVDPTRVSGPIRVVLEPMLWMAFVSGLVWLLVALDPGLREPAPGVVVYQYTLPLAVLIGALLVISTISALMWLPTSTSATRARTSFAGLGMLASGWLFAKLHPVETEDFLGLSWLSIGVGVLLVTICSVPWPTVATRIVRRRGPITWALVGMLLAASLGVALAAWEAARQGLVGELPGSQTGWDAMMPLLALLALLLAAVRLVLRHPLRVHAG